MKITVRKGLFLLMTLGFVHSGFAQGSREPEAPIKNTTYKNAIGLRGGGTSGLTYKHFEGNNTAFEGILGLWRQGFSLTGLYEKYASAGVQGLNFYYGAGGHLSFETNGRQSTNINGERRGGYTTQYDRRDRFGVGVDGIVGLEYKISSIPFAISLDVKPFVEISNNYFMFYALDAGLGVKYTF